MASFIRWISIDCADPYRLCRFYAAVTGRTADAEPRGDECAAPPPTPDYPGLLFTRVPEGKIGELRTDDRALTCANTKMISDIAEHGRRASYALQTAWPTLQRWPRQMRSIRRCCHTENHA